MLQRYLSCITSHALHGIYSRINFRLDLCILLQLYIKQHFAGSVFTNVCALRKKDSCVWDLQGFCAYSITAVALEGLFVEMFMQCMVKANASKRGHSCGVY